MRLSLIALSVLVSGLVQAESKKVNLNAEVAKPSVTEQKNVRTAAVETPKVTQTVTAAQPVAATQAQPIGEVEVRPSMLTNSVDSFRTENYVAVGVKPSADMKVLYHQDFYTNLFTTATTGDGLNLIAKDGYARMSLDNIYQSGNSSLGYQLRVYAPTDAGKRDASMITIVRNYLSFTQKITDRFSVTAAEVAIFHAYSQADNGKLGADRAANPFYENRVFVSLDYQISDALSFSLPITYYLTRTRNAAGTKNNGRWENYVDVYPELSYALTPNYTLGAAYYNNSNLLADGDVPFGEGLNDGIFQLVFRATL